MSRFTCFGVVTLLCAVVPTLPALAAEAALHSKPVTVEALDGTLVKKVTLTQKAADRLGIQMAEVREDPAKRLIVPYAAILYDLSGTTWVYTSPRPLTFVRQQVKLEQIQNENAFLAEGPPVGTKVLTVGVPQVFGAEVGVGH